MNKLRFALTAVRELGLRKLLQLALYRFGLQNGHYQRTTPTPIPQPASANPAFNDLFTSPGADFFTSHRVDTAHSLAEAAAICQGQVRLFGGEPVELNLAPQPPLAHWTMYERSHATWGGEDIKSLWEPARFSWAFQLVRAHAIHPDEAYLQAFWRYFEQFQIANPPYLGPNWMSAQEAALRILAFTFCDQAFAHAKASTPERRQVLIQSIAEHAERIPPTLIYARSQNNNHLLSEAVGLYSAAAYLPDHPQASRWRKLGWHWFNWGIQNQVSAGGTYVQHSVNYHRLMLQLSLWMHTLTKLPGAEPLPEQTLSRLAAATQWLQALTDPNSGRAPNLGANDGAHILPLSNLPQDDYRPTLQAAGCAFLKHTLLPKGPWDELGAWLGIPLEQPSAPSLQPQAHDMPRIDTTSGRAFLRAAHFNDRPSHADQLHVDLWFRGENITLDPGTFSYNASPPWQNALASSLVHNTLTINCLEQMTPISRFLWLNWAQAEILKCIHGEDGQVVALTARHDGYKQLGWQHQRTLASRQDGTWVVDDLLIPIARRPASISVRLAWLLPDLPWRLEGNQFTLELSKSSLTLAISGADLLAVVRAGECIHGDLKPRPTWGWHSNTYGQKAPALQLIAMTNESVKPFFSSIFSFR
jgi:hypothetical protein